MDPPGFPAEVCIATVGHRTVLENTLREGFFKTRQLYEYPLEDKTLYARTGLVAVEHQKVFVYSGSLKDPSADGPR